jgi:DNA-directed RNA polymerase beta' subunit
MGEVTQDELDAIRIGLASPETIRSWSHGEMKNRGWINYRAFTLARGGDSLDLGGDESGTKRRAAAWP